MIHDPNFPKEGDLYKRITLAGHTFELRYGYYEERERSLCSPVVIFPNLSASALYSPDGYPLVTQIQDACEYYKNVIAFPENWCGDCAYFSGEHPEIGVCRCEYKNILSGGIENENTTLQKGHQHSAVSDAADGLSAYDGAG